VVQKIFLVFVVVSIFACGLVIMVTNGRLIFSMARDRRLPGHQLLHQVPRPAGGPPGATIGAAVLGGVITLALRTHTAALATLFTASTIMPALLYAGTVLLYVLTSRRSSQRRGGGGEGGVFPPRSASPSTSPGCWTRPGCGWCRGRVPRPRRRPCLLSGRRARGRTRTRP
jgi:amino acid transporter